MSLETNFGLKLEYNGALTMDVLKSSTFDSEITIFDGNVTTSGDLDVDGSITSESGIAGDSFSTTGNITADGSVTVDGSISGASLSSTGNISTGEPMTVPGAMNAGSVVSTTTIASTGNISSDGSITAIGSVGSSSIVSTGGVACTTIDTGQGANECYAMDQDVTTTDDVTFSTLAINGTNDASALATFTSSTLGLLPPRMTSTEREAIVSPADGLVVFDETENSLFSKASSDWSEIQPVIPSLRTEGNFRYDNSGGDITIVPTAAPVPLSVVGVLNGISLNADGQTIELSANKAYVISATFYANSYNGSSSLLIIEAQASTSLGGTYTRIGDFATVVPSTNGGGSYLTIHPCTNDTFVRIVLSCDVDSVTLTSNATIRSYSSVIITEI